VAGLLLRESDGHEAPLFLNHGYLNRLLTEVQEHQGDFREKSGAALWELALPALCPACFLCGAVMVEAEEITLPAFRYRATVVPLYYRGHWRARGAQAMP